MGAPTPTCVDAHPDRLMRVDGGPTLDPELDPEDLDDREVREQHAARVESRTRLPGQLVGRDAGEVGLEERELVVELGDEERELAGAITGWRRDDGAVVGLRHGDLLGAGGRASPTDPTRRVKPREAGLRIGP